MRSAILCLLPAIFLMPDVHAIEPTQSAIEFARVGDHALLLDFYAPSEAIENAPLIIWVHGGAWRAGSRTRMPIGELTKHGYAIASVDYRLSGDAAFPAQVHDIKSAIRYLRANATKFKVDSERFVIAGASAGGHLAALVGVSSGVEELEGTVGAHVDTSSQVHAIVSFYGAANLATILAQSTPHGLSVRVPALQLLLRDPPDKNPELAKLASPVTHVDGKDPPLMLIHGDQDPQMPINQSHELTGAYQRAGSKVIFEVVHGGAHGGAGFYEPKMIQKVLQFLD